MIRLWLWPILLAILTLSGLVSGLVSDEAGDVWAWVGLGVPVLIGLYYGFIRRSA